MCSAGFRGFCQLQTGTLRLYNCCSQVHVWRVLLIAVEASQVTFIKLFAHFQPIDDRFARRLLLNLYRPQLLVRVARILQYVF